MELADRQGCIGDHQGEISVVMLPIDRGALHQPTAVCHALPELGTRQGYRQEDLDGVDASLLDEAAEGGDPLPPAHREIGARSQRIREDEHAVHHEANGAEATYQVDHPRGVEMLVHRLQFGVDRRLDADRHHPYASGMHGLEEFAVGSAIEPDLHGDEEADAGPPLVVDEAVAQRKGLVAILREMVVDHEQFAGLPVLDQMDDLAHDQFRGRAARTAAYRAEFARHGASADAADRIDDHVGVAQETEIGLRQQREILMRRPIWRPPALHRADPIDVAPRAALRPGFEQLRHGDFAFAMHHHIEPRGQGFLGQGVKVLPAADRQHLLSLVVASDGKQPWYGAGQATIEADHGGRPDGLQCRMIGQTVDVHGARRAIIVFIDDLDIPIRQPADIGGHHDRTEGGGLVGNPCVDVDRWVARNDHTEKMTLDHGWAAPGLETADWTPLDA